VITLCDKVRGACPELPGARATAHWSIADPAAETGTDDDTLPAFERTARDLEDRIGHLVARLTTRGGTANVG
jgi:arsenate reductase